MPSKLNSSDKGINYHSGLIYSDFFRSILAIDLVNDRLFFTD